MQLIHTFLVSIYLSIRLLLSDFLKQHIMARKATISRDRESTFKFILQKYSASSEKIYTFQSSLTFT